MQTSVRQKLQKLLDEYKSGVRVREVQLLAVDPPQMLLTRSMMCSVPVKTGQAKERSGSLPQRYCAACPW